MKRKPPTILFVCRENACRSQMAEGFARFYGKETVETWSAGSTPRGAINEGAVAVMQEDGIQLADQRSKGLDRLPRRTWDVVVTMGCGDACPSLSARHRFDWDIPDPKGQSPEQYRKVREMIRDAVKALLTQVPELTGR